MNTLRKAIIEALRLLGPEAPECCGCKYEWQHAINILQEALETNTVHPLSAEQLIKIRTEGGFKLYCEADEFVDIARAIEEAHEIKED